MTRTALDFARLLNEARVLLAAVYENSDTLHRASDVATFLDKCREQIGPIVEPPAAKRDEAHTAFPGVETF